MLKTADIQIRDPFILVSDGFYYLYGTTDKDCWDKAPGCGFDTYRSKNLADWEGPFPAFRPSKDFWGKHNFWAPEVYSYKGAFYMFASFIGEKGDGTNRGTAILRAEKPEGPFTPWSDGAVTPKEWMCLDGTFYIDKNNDPWIVFCHEWVQIRDGTICAQRLSHDLKKAEGEAVTLFKASYASWSKGFESNKLPGSCHVTDGCNMFAMKNGKLLMQWSTIGFEGYCIGYAVSENGSVTGPWKQSSEPVFKKDGGHGMLFRTFDGKLMLTIHQPNDTPNERAIFIEVEETEDGIRRK